MTNEEKNKFDALLKEIESNFATNKKDFDKSTAFLIIRVDTIFIDLTLQKHLESSLEKPSWYESLLASKRNFEYIPVSIASYLKIKELCGLSHQILFITQKSFLSNSMLRFLKIEYLSTIIKMGFFTLATPSSTLRQDLELLK